MITILLVKPGAPVEVATIEPKVPDFMIHVGGATAQTRLGPKVLLVCNNEGDRLDLRPNRILQRPGTTVVRGAFVLCGAKGDGPASLAPHHLAIWRAYFDAAGAHAKVVEA